MIQKSKLFAESWNVAWRSLSYGNILSDKKSPFNIIKNPVRYWAADPFLFEYEGEVYVFAELYDYIRRRGGIGYCKISDYKKRWIPIIFEDYHMSYPYIFEKNGNIYLMPETSASGTLCMYKARKFPDDWEKYTIVRSGVKLADTTIFCWEERNVALSYKVEDALNPELVLLELDNIDNDVIVNIDQIKLRRPAGKHLLNNIRPAQNCEEDYGKGIIFYKYIIENNEYSEKEIDRIYPYDLSYDRKLFLDGMHTYNYCNNYEVVDIKTRRFNVINLLSRVIGKIRF